MYLKPSPWLTGCILVVHFGAATALVAVDLNVLAISAVLIAITGSLVHAMNSFILQKHPDTPVQLLLTAGGEWWLSCVSGQTWQVQLLPAGYVHPFLTVLTFREHGGRRYAVIVTHDVVDADMFRRLRVRLRFMHDR
ncbi:MAG: protein YgfX [Gammaproteobacteria bacterium]